MFHLPAELLLQILSYLPIRQIAFVRLVSRAWDTFVTENEAAVYHAVAILHNFAKSHQRLQECKGNDAFPFLEDVASWKELCRRHFMLEMRWTGQLRARQGTISSLGRAVHRFKIDEEQKTVILTLATGGLMVVSIENDVFLWTLRSSEVRQHAHCEYGGGFLVFDRLDGSLEIWRRKCDSQADPLPSNPDLRQVEAARTGLQSPESIGQNDRGAFVPFRTIAPPHDLRAYRFVYPTLLVACEDTQDAYMFDVRTGEMIQRISLEVDPNFRIEITYVELSTRHVFVCTEDHGLLIFSRAPSRAPPFIRFCPAIDACQEAFDLRSTPRPQPQVDLADFTEMFLEMQKDLPVDLSLGPGCAVHVSPCGSHLVFANSDGFVYIIRHFETTLGQPHPPKHSIPVISIPSRITNMAFEEDRIAFYAVTLGLLVIPFASQDRIPATGLGNSLESSWPRLYLAYKNSRSFPHFPPWNIDPDMYCSCVQMNRTGVWFVSYERTRQEEAELLLKRLRYVDFSQTPLISPSEEQENRIIPVIRYD